METKKLFGGALVFKKPKEFSDVSGISGVPDHQEVFTDVDTGCCIIIELLARNEDIADADSARIHFDEHAKSSSSYEHKLCSVREAGFCQLCYESYSDSENAETLMFAKEVTDNQRAFTYFPYIVSPPMGFVVRFNGSQRVHKFKEEGAENIVWVEAVLGRLLSPIDTDILLTVTAPTEISTRSSEFGTVRRTLKHEEIALILENCAKELKIINWSLFC